jgi:hypothetical protein
MIAQSPAKRKRNQPSRYERYFPQSWPHWNADKLQEDPFRRLAMRFHLLLALLLSVHPVLAQAPGSGSDAGLPVIITGKAAVDQLKKARPAPAPGTLNEHLVAFDPDSAELTWSDGHWQIQAGGKILKDFGRHETAARQTLWLIRELVLTQYGTIGGSPPALEYWLHNGAAPQGIPTGLHTSPVDQNSLRIDKIYGQFCLRDGYRILLGFGTNENDARQALAVLKKYAFTQVGMIGQFSPPLLIFLTQPGDQFGAGSVAPQTTAGTVMPTLATVLPTLPGGRGSVRDPFTVSGGQSTPRTPGTGP